MTEETNNMDGFNPSKLILPGAIILAGVMISAAVIYSNGSFGGPANIRNTPNNKVAVASVDVDDDPFLGDKKAPVVLIEFSDFQCPFCERFFQTVEPQLIKNYVQTGKVRFVYRDYAFLGDESKWAAQAANCANEQNKFWEYHDYLFNHQNGENRGAFTKSNLKNFAGALGLNANKFNECLDNEKYADEVAKDLADAQKAGVSGTPTVFINGKSVVGAQPFEAFRSVIEEELNK